MTPVKLPSDVMRFADGQPIVVLRPEDPRLVLALAKVAVQHQSEEAMRETTRGMMTMVGYLVKRNGKHAAVDADGCNPQELQPGDVFSAPSMLTKAD